ncbi:unnamed protein product [Closterium sp. NIES-53]
MEVARTSVIHAAAPHFLWSFAVRYAAHQLNLWPRVSLPETSPTLRWTGKVGNVFVFRVWGSRAFVRNTSADKLSSRAIPCVFLSFPRDAPGWKFYHPTLRRVLSSQDITFIESVPITGSQVDPLPVAKPVEVTVYSGAAGGGAARGAVSRGAELAGAELGGAEPERAEPGGAEAESAEPGGVESEGAEPGGAEPESAEPGGAESEGAESGGAEPRGTSSAGGPAGASPRLSRRREPLSPWQLREWFSRRTHLRSGAAGAGGPAAGGTGAGGAGATSPGGAGVTAGVGGTRGAGAVGLGGARTRGTGAARASGVGGAGAGDYGAGGIGAGGAGGGGTGAGDPGAGGTGARGAGTRGAGARGAGAGDPGAGGAGAGGTGAGDSGAGGSGAGDPRAGGAGVGGAGAGGAAAGGTGAGGTGARGAGARGAGAGGAGSGGSGTGGARARDPGAGGAGAGGARAGGTGAGSTVQRRPFFVPPPPSSLPQPNSRREPESRPASPVRAICTGRRVPRPRPPPVPGTHIMALCLSSVPLRVPLPSSPASSLADGPDPDSDLVRAASPTVPRLLATVVTDPSFDSAAASALVSELVDFAAAYRLDYAASLDAESGSDCPPSDGGECALGTDVLQDTQEDFECLAAAVPHLVAMQLAPEGDPDALDISTPCSYAVAITGPYSSQWLTNMDAEMASWKSTVIYADAVPPPGANIVDGMWIFRVKRPPGPPPVFKARYVARGFSQRQGVDFFQTFSPTPNVTTLRVPSGASGGQSPHEWHDTLRMRLAALGFAPSTADPSLFLRTDTSLPPFYILVYVGDLVFATADTEALALVKSELQTRHTCTDLGPIALQLLVLLATVHSSAYRSLALSSTFGRVREAEWPVSSACGLPHVFDDLAYPLSILARYVAPRKQRPEHWKAAKRVLRYLCSTSGMGLVLGGRGPVVLTGHANASWVDELATQRLSQGYTFSLGSGSVSWRSTRSSSVLSSSCEAEIYAGAMDAQELR